MNKFMLKARETTDWRSLYDVLCGINAEYEKVVKERDEAFAALEKCHDHAPVDDGGRYNNCVACVALTAYAASRGK